LDLSKLKFLVVDGDETARNHIESLLQKLGAIRVDKATQGKEALHKIKKSYSDGMPYALIALEWELSEISGFDILKTIREDRDMRSAVIMMISSKSDTESLKAIASLFPDTYVVKPFTEEVFEQKFRLLYPKFSKV